MSWRLLLSSLIALSPTLSACDEEERIAYGNFEADEVVVSAEVGGQLVSFEADEGEEVPAGAALGVVDARTLVLQREEVGTQVTGASARAAQAEAEIDVLRAQLATATEEYERTRRLFAGEAATAQALNRAEGEVRVLRERIEAGLALVSAARQEASGAESRGRQIEERIADTRITNPVAGTVLATYAEAGELVQPGQPLYKIARLDPITLRAYLSGADVSMLRLGESVTVRIDGDGDDLVTMSGRVTWIASEAEFTPTPIQTREERTDQVYAVKVTVANPRGLIKIGMPGELLLPEPGVDGTAKPAAISTSNDSDSP